ncbi:MAG TPA: hypothetical protein VEK57_01920 [Thermoanaerobaculia bacterium]|nr:hypothetical protein [Thermoanaerobaculia bacterium]
MRDFAAAESLLLQFGGLLQSLPKLLAEVETSLPHASQELQHLSRHHYREWALVQNDALFVQFTDETVLCRLVDAFHIYLADVIRLTLKHEPRLLRSNTVLKAEEILDYNSLDEIVEHLITKKVDELAYRGFHAVLEYVRKGMGATMSLSEDVMSSATRAIAVRNIIVHNRGVVNQRFIDQTGASDVSPGSPYNVRTADVLSWGEALRQVVFTLDAALATHFRIPQKTLEPRRRRGAAF